MSRVAAQRRPGLGAEERRRRPGRPTRSPRTSATTTSSGCYPSFGNLAPRDIVVAGGQARGRLRPRRRPAEERRVPRLRRRDRPPRQATSSRSATATCSRCTSASPARTRTTVPMRIYPAPHYTMGGLWVDYELMTTIPGLYCAGEANFSDHGANRLGASALMQGLADGYFVLPYTIGNYLAPLLNKPIPGTDHPEFKAAEAGGARALRRATSRSRAPARPTASTASSARSSGTTAAWSARQQGLEKALSEIPALYEEFQKDLRVTGDGADVNQTLEKAGRVDDFFELGMLMCRDALEREESCGGHFRAEYQTEEGEAQARRRALRPRRRVGVDRRPDRRRSATSKQLEFENVHLASPELQVSTSTDDVERSRSRSGARTARTTPAASRPTRSTRSATRRRSSRCSTSLNERLIDEGKEAIVVRPRLPRGHLRHVLADDQRPGPRPAAGHGHVPAAHAQVRTTATRSSSSRGGPRAFPIIKDLMVDRAAFDRIVEAGGFITAADRRRARRQPHPDPQAGRRRGDGRRRVHRLRRLRGRLPERRRQPVHRGQGRPPQPAAAGPGRALRAGRGDGGDDGGVLRLVHEPRRVRGGVPEGDLDRLHRAR